MYDELVMRLRKLSGTDNLSEFDEAADAIEELSKRVPVPPHGRLIDADALMQNAEYKGTHDILTAWDVVTAPTIIPAEEGE